MHVAPSDDAHLLCRFHAMKLGRERLIVRLYRLLRVIAAMCFAVSVMLPIYTLVDLWRVGKSVHSAILYGGFLAFGLGMNLANRWLSDEKFSLYIAQLTLAGKNEWFKTILIYFSLVSGGYLVLSHLMQKRDNVVTAILGIILLAVGFASLHMRKTNAKS